MKSDKEKELERLLHDLHKFSLELAGLTIRRLTSDNQGTVADRSWSEHYERRIGAAVRNIQHHLGRLKDLGYKHWNVNLFPCDY